MKKLNMSSVIIGFLLFVFSFISVSEIYAAEKNKVEWKPEMIGEIFDISPFAYANDFGLLVEFTTGQWITCLHSKKDGIWPSAGQKGIMYQCVVGDKRYWKWVRNKEKSKPQSKVIPNRKPKKFKRKSIADLNVAAPDPNEIISDKIEIWSKWKPVFRELPEIGETVLVKYVDGETITTAYLNDKEEWKLETERATYRGGKTIEVVDMWCSIPKELK